MRLTTAVLFALPAAPLAAQMPAAVCAAKPVSPPAEMSGWSAPLAAAASSSVAGATAIAVGTAYRLTLQPMPRVAFAVAPKHGGPEGYGGLVRIVVSTEGTYRVALGSGAWVDVIAGGRALPSTGHGHGPDCTGIRKMVDYALAPGSYLVGIAGNRDATITAMVARLP